MLNKDNVKKIALFLGYALFSAWSAYLTTTSVSHKWFSATSQLEFIMVYIMVFIFALIAGYFLKVAIGQVKNTVNPSKGKFFGALTLFIIFWGFSFATNVHYFIVSQHGYDNLCRQVASCKSYLENESTKGAAAADKEKQQIFTYVSEKVRNFENSLESSRAYMDGLGDECISELKAIESYLNRSNDSYHDQNTYKIWDEKYHGGFRKGLGYNDYGHIKQTFNDIINRELKKKYEAIDAYYKRMYNPAQLKKAKEMVTQIETTALPQLQKNDASFDQLYDCYKKDITPLLGNMPSDYKNYAKSHGVYPSERMFDFTNVWADKFSGRLPNYISFGGAVPMALLLDLAAFILIALI